MTPHLPVAPCNISAERSVLGSILLDPSLLTAVIESGLEADHFSVSAHSRIWRTLVEMRDSFEPIDSISLLDQLGEITDADVALVSDLVVGAIGDRGHVLHHAAIVRRKADLRRLLHLSEWLSHESMSNTADPQEISRAIVSQLPNIAAEQIGGGL